MSIPPSRILSLQKDPSKIRNICVIAHVDHGKTTLCDSLVATNGFISEKSAGKLRFLDSRDDEQRRMITMKASAISLTYKNEYLVNLIDSPGHVDFTAEVSAATRLSDGAIVMVDVVEGISSQTREVLRQAWADQLRIVLVLNKIDRLLINLQLTADEAHLHLQKVIEQANAAVGELIMGDVLGAERGGGGTTPRGGNAAGRGDVGGGAVVTEGAAPPTSEGQATPSGSSATPSNTPRSSAEENTNYEIDFDEEKQKKYTFHPAKGNVLFTSAMHGWGFSIEKFAEFVAAKTGMSKEVLLKTLWGEFTYNPKTKKVQRMKRMADGSCNSRSMFSQFCLETIWRFYSSTGTIDNTERAKVQGELDVPLLEKLVKSIPDLRDHPRVGKMDLSKLKPGCVKDLLGCWLPLSETILKHCCRVLPSPVEAAVYRVPALLEVYPPPAWVSPPEEVKGVGFLTRIRHSLVGCPAPDTPAPGAAAAAVNGNNPTPSTKPAEEPAGGATPVRQKNNVHETTSANYAARTAAALVCSAPSSSPVVAYCTKYLGADLERLTLLGDRLVRGGADDQFVAMVRVFAGTLKPNTVLRAVPSSTQRGKEGAGKEQEGSSPQGSGEGEGPASSHLTGDVGAGGRGPTTLEEQEPVIRLNEKPSDTTETEDWQLVDADAPKSDAMISVAGEDPLLVADSPQGNVSVPEEPAFTTSSGRDETGTAVPEDDSSSGTSSLFGSGKKGAETNSFASFPGLKVDKVFTLLGSQLQEISEASAGAVVAVSFAGTSLHKTERYLTLLEEPPEPPALSSGSLLRTTPCWLPTFRSPYSATRSFSIVKVSIEAKKIDEAKHLMRGLALLHRADPSLDITQMASGDHVIGCCGDEHLSRSIRDLQKLYLPDFVELVISDPLIAVRETIGTPKEGFGVDLVRLPWLQGGPPAEEEAGGELYQGGANSAAEESRKHGRGCYPAVASNAAVTLKVRAEPLSPKLLSVSQLSEKKVLLRRIRNAIPDAGSICVTKGAKTVLTLMRSAGPSPRAGGEGSRSPRGAEENGELLEITGNAAKNTGNSPSEVLLRHPWLVSALTTGFEVASHRGPLCEEPVVDVHFILEAVTVHLPPGSGSQAPAHFSGLAISAMREGCSEAMLRRSTPRIAEPVLLLELHSDQLSLGKVYGVVSKRRANILSEDLLEGTSNFKIMLELPMIESFTLSGELRHAAGDVHYNVSFLGFRTLAEDPFYECSRTLDEIEDEGEIVVENPDQAASISRRILTGVRRRKGLPVDQVMVRGADKQRTITRNK